MRFLENHCLSWERKLLNVFLNLETQIVSDNSMKKSLIKYKRGQTVVEYILVISVLVGAAMAAYVAIRQYLPGTLTRVKASLEGSSDAKGPSAGSGQKSYDYYYKNVEFKSK